MKDALDRRYREATERAAAKGAGAQAAELDSAGSSTSAVVCMSLSRAKEFIGNETTLYSTYQLQVRSSVRQASEPADDRMRLSVDSTVHGTYGEMIRYAALSIDGLGPASYGEVSLKLRDIAVASRATVLEQNSWSFVQSRDLFGKELPPGYLATWGERNKLVCAKLADLLTPKTSSSEFATLILTQATSRSEEEFLEVHVYGAFNMDSVESVSGPSNPTKQLDIALVAWLKDKLDALGKTWVGK
ncbi:MAG: hypothetical protein ABSG10_12005 [Terracidiphilus sp.]|jgi:hypothetical protein